MWGEYARATVEHVRLEADLEIACIQQDRKRIEELTPLVEAACERRTALRQAIAEHERLVHTEIAQTATSDTGL